MTRTPPATKTRSVLLPDVAGWSWGSSPNGITCMYASTTVWRCGRTQNVLDWDVEVTIGWTISDPESGYSSFSDGYRPGAKQHCLTVRVHVPDEVNDASVVETIADAAFTATNHPYPHTLRGIARQIHDGVTASNYRGSEAHYSLSVGDTVTVSEVTLACARTGWQRVSYVGAGL